MGTPPNVHPSHDVDPHLSRADQASFALPPDDTAPAPARNAVRTTFMGWQLPTLIEDAVVSVSELVTNALHHGLPPVGLLLRRRTGQVRMDVDDALPDPLPARPRANHLAESGRGLHIVRTLADDVGVEQIPGDGKAVYAVWNMPQTPTEER